MKRILIQIIIVSIVFSSCSTSKVTSNSITFSAMKSSTITAPNGAKFRIFYSNTAELKYYSAVAVNYAMQHSMWTRDAEFEIQMSKIIKIQDNYKACVASIN